MNTYKLPLRCHLTRADSEQAQLAIYIGRTVNDDQYRRVSCHGKGVDLITEREASCAQVRRVFVPFDQRGLELAPRAGLPFLHFRSEHQIWLIEQVVSNYQWYLVRANKSCLPYETIQRQFQKDDLKYGVVLAIQQDAHPKAPFATYIQVGFDFDFKPVAIIRKPRFYVRPSGPSWRTMLIGPFNRTSPYPPRHNFWTNSVSNDRPDDFKTVGCRFEGLTFGPVTQLRLLACRSDIRLSLKPLHGLGWQMNIERQQLHPNVWSPNSSICALCILSRIPSLGLWVLWIAGIVCCLYWSIYSISGILTGWLAPLLASSNPREYAMILLDVQLQFHVVSWLGISYLYGVARRNSRILD